RTPQTRPRRHPRQRRRDRLLRPPRRAGSRLMTGVEITPAQLQQLRVLEAGRGAVNLGTVRALVRRGLVREQYGNELQQGVRMASAYPLTPAGRAALEEAS